MDEALRVECFFTGREKVFAEVRSHLTKEQIGAIAQFSATSATQVLSGLAGIGKTQTAVEYAYRYRDRYIAVFWVKR